MFVYQLLSKPTTVTEYVAGVSVAFRTSVLSVLEEYPVSFFSSDTRPEMSILVTEYLFGCSTRRAAFATSKYVPTYLYYYDHALSFDGYLTILFCFCFILISTTNCA